MAKAGTESVYFHPNPSLLPRYWVWILLLCLTDWIWTQGPNKCKLWRNSSLYFAGWTTYEILKIKVILIYPCNKTENVTLQCHFIQILLVLWCGSCLVKIKFILVYSYVLMWLCLLPGAHLLTQRQYWYSGCLLFFNECVGPQLFQKDKLKSLFFLFLYLLFSKFTLEDWM